MPVSTDVMVQCALDMAGMRQLPGDSAVYVPGDGIRRLLVALDVGPAELLLARELGCDGVLAHHPAGGDAVVHFVDVLARHVDLMVEHGVPREEAKAAIAPLVRRLTLQHHAQNYEQTPAVARLLGLPFLNLHLPLDEVGRRVIAETIERHCASLGREPLVQDVLDALLTIPEFATAPMPPMVPVGAVDRPAGRIAVVHGAGTNGGAAVARAYFAHGVGTVLYLHLAPAELEALHDARGNVVVMGHLPGDLVGINRYLTVLAEYDVEIVRLIGVEAGTSAPQVPAH